MSLKDARQKFSEIQKDISNSYFSEHSENTKQMIDLLKECPVLCHDALDMIKENSDDIHDSDKKDLLDNIIQIEPKLNLDIIRRMNEFNIADSVYRVSKVTDILGKQPNLAENITNKGIPVVTNEKDGEIVQHAEIEHSEIIYNLEVSNKLEELRKKDKENTNDDSYAIEAGKLIVEETLRNTDDRVGLINNIE
jgi:hypothetical protein